MTLDSKTYYRAKSEWTFYKENVLGLMFQTNKILREAQKAVIDSNQREKREHDFVTGVLELYRILRVKIMDKTGVDFRRKDDFIHLLELDKVDPDKKFDFKKMVGYFNDLCSLIDNLGYSRVEDAEYGEDISDYT